MIPTATPTARRRWPWFLLVGSLAVNMLAGGFAVAHMLRPPPPPPGPEAVAHFIDGVSKHLPAADAAILRNALDEARPLFARMDEKRAAFGPRLRAELAAKPFDQERLKALIDANRVEDERLRGEIDDRVVTTLGRLSPEARHRLSESRVP
ncbi:periplasmic heavy metal sensor [Azospirillum doebereinerae]|uniref:Periplasmic heavy metal sensor n=1 Tax=Azospirillum doebereinerae TaxID=92933 RepID=A0A3S1CIT0_9PROT|nr:periplasmic heavy metal sensor [Azospirillum doebereinerae]RUQ74599.1 periplasmic heavy metal sensor [Azospirillum doebereinerae]